MNEQERMGNDERQLEPDGADDGLYLEHAAREAGDLLAAGDVAIRQLNLSREQCEQFLKANVQENGE